jgi:hypothetical protein
MRWIPGLYRAVEWSGRGFDHPPTPSPKVKERIELFLYSTVWAFVACSRVNFTFTHNARL